MAEFDDTTLGEFLSGVRRDREAAWGKLHGLAHSVVRRSAKRQRLQSADVDDVGDAVLLRAVVDDFAALRRGDASAPLGAWLSGIARNVVRERRRGDRRRSAVPVEELAEPRRDERHRTPTSARRRVDLDLLTSAQRAVVRRLLDGSSERRIAAELGVTRDRVHDVKRRAMARLRSGRRFVPTPATTDRSWAARAAETAREGGDAVNARVLELFAEGATRADIAKETGLTAVAVKERIRRRRPRD